ncbi:MAG: selenocysteine-specific translation elongation factor [Chloroflexota bacterium]
MRVIGTAGHVDHGKSTLVEALTGVHPDRLKEEQAREMTIDLGFAYLNLPDGEEIGIVDVPGHRDFIENMLAGIGSIDACLFVIAADEGIMPQTREHLAILDLLQIQSGVIALTKIDLVDDPEFLDLVEDDIRKAFKGSTLDGTPIVRVSARKRIGIDEILQALKDCLVQKAIRPDLGRPRLSVDRIFTMAGFGTVVTGTLIDGCFHLDDEIEILPQSQRSRVRGLQSHQHKVTTALPGSRTAVNIAGVTVNQVARGNVITLPGTYQPTSLMDVQFRLLPDASHSLKHNTEVKLFIGADEVLARVRLLGTEELPVGKEAFLQLELSDPTVAIRGDRYILRRPSPSETIGGGIVLNPQPTGHHRRFDLSLLEHLEALVQGDPSDFLFQAVQALGTPSIQEAIQRARISGNTALEAAKALVSAKNLIVVNPDTGQALSEIQSIENIKDYLILLEPFWQQTQEHLEQTLQAYHQNFPLRTGMPREELKNRAKIATRIFIPLVKSLVHQGKIVEKGGILYSAQHQIRFTPEQQRLINTLLTKFKAAPYAPPTIKECQAQLGGDLYAALVNSDEFVPVSPEVVFRKGDYEQIRTRIVRFLEQNNTITVAQARDLLDTSRRYVLAVLEYFDSTGLTIRDGDFRRLRSKR